VTRRKAHARSASQSISHTSILGDVVMAGELSITHATIPGDRYAYAADLLAAKSLPFWAREATRLGIEPAPVAVRWEPAPPDLAPAMDSPTSGVVTQLHRDLYIPLGTDTLVILGDAGCGKSGAMLLLLLTALRQRAMLPAHERSCILVPVWVSCGAWDPSNTTLSNHVAGILARDFPALTSIECGGKAGPVELIERGLISVFLDGLDEMPAPFQATALHRVAAETGHIPVVLSSRTAQYRVAVHDTRFRPARVIQLQRVDRAAATSFLLARQSLDRASLWRSALEFLENRPDGPVSQVLSTPLGLALARDTYTTIDPRHFAMNEYSSDGAVLTHLFGAFLDQAYPAFTDHERKVRDANIHWLGWLAHNMGAQRDLHWWRIPTWNHRHLNRYIGRAVAIWAWLVVGVGLMGALTPLLSGFLARKAYKGISRYTSTLTWKRVEIGPKTWSTRRPSRRDLPQLRQGFILGIAASVMGGLVTSPISLPIIWLFRGTFHPRDPSFPPTRLPMSLLAEIGWLIVGGILMATIEAWTTPVTSSLAITPGRSYRIDCRVSIARALAVGGGAGLTAGGVTSLITGTPSGFLVGIFTALAVGAGVGIATGLVPALKFFEFHLRLHGGRSVRFHRLCEDALSRHVLRQAGSAYQFRHAELQEYLCTKYRRQFPAPKGWYADPWNLGSIRYWDGGSWTPHWTTTPPHPSPDQPLPPPRRTTATLPAWMGQRPNPQSRSGSPLCQWVVGGEPVLDLGEGQATRQTDGRLTAPGSQG
jgi:hypothetical protein